jgi:hypothetical protein
MPSSPVAPYEPVNNEARVLIAAVPLVVAHADDLYAAFCPSPAPSSCGVTGGRSWGQGWAVMQVPVPASVKSIRRVMNSILSHSPESVHEH